MHLLSLDSRVSYLPSRLSTGNSLIQPGGANGHARGRGWESYWVNGIVSCDRSVAVVVKVARRVGRVDPVGLARLGKGCQSYRVKATVGGLSFDDDNVVLLARASGACVARFVWLGIVTKRLFLGSKEESRWSAGGREACAPPTKTKVETRVRTNTSVHCKGGGPAIVGLSLVGRGDEVGSTGSRG